jgi:4-hydroxy-tetrahydrodipicolinate reductase
MSTTNIIIIGAKGRMGQMLISCAKTDPALQVVAGLDIGDDLDRHIAGCDVIVEFALREATTGTAKAAAAHKKALVIGTTGHSDAEAKTIRDILKPVPVVWASNYSTGVNVLFWATRQVSNIVGPTWEAEVIETHHTAKKDAPSGTAKTLQTILRQTRGKDAPAHALRIGDVVGDHTVVFGTVGERVELSHRAASRETFARGALRAAKWVVNQHPGLYDMQDVLGLRSRNEQVS